MTPFTDDELRDFRGRLASGEWSVLPGALALRMIDDAAEYKRAALAGFELARSLRAADPTFDSVREAISVRESYEELDRLACEWVKNRPAPSRPGSPG